MSVEDVLRLAETTVETVDEGLIETILAKLTSEERSLWQMTAPIVLDPQALQECSVASWCMSPPGGPCSAN